ncbi:HEAT repeat domain-containing protein [Chroococcidiopsis sp. CCMEE 29]|uniref:HEAT repeat domain-containing protein n=1 Tax=Chroococcidiopsis sp. CCMEE 29 TaxID=155894 RepID=UPI0020214AE6|nr:HEAT repeat domain-containing protein [Chroococcidiopsis sp. CCMEE 29]
MVTRKGASRPLGVPTDIQQRLNSGVIQTVNLSECLVVDFAVLMAQVVPELAGKAVAQICPNDGITKRMAIAGQLLFDQLGADGIPTLLEHPSDTVRGWAAYLIAAIPDLPLAERLSLVRPLADDSHFGVREWAWLAIRSYIAADIKEAIALLISWLSEASPNVRRFAVESTRPRGVWCSHIKDLKTKPEIGLPLLEPVRSDSSAYVQDSVANWLNDAAKSQAAWVYGICQRWQRESQTPATQRICTRALRSLNS